jgi:hypothetical protein
MSSGIAALNQTKGVAGFLQPLFLWAYLMLFWLARF